MMFKIAFRNIFRQKRRTILTALTMFGGFALASFSIGWSDGSYNFIINMFTRNQLGHIQIHKGDYRDRPSLYKTIDDYQQVGEKISKLAGVEGWAPRAYSAGLVSVGENSTGTRIIGIDPQLENQATHFDKKIVSGTPFSLISKHEAILGKGLAQVLKASLGDEVVVVSQAADGSIANDLYSIIGIVETGDAITDRTSFYLPLPDFQELFVMEGKVHEIAILVENLDAVSLMTERIREALNIPDLEVAPWQEFAKSFYQAMQADVKGMWIMLVVIMIIVAVGVLNTVLMSVLERQREYGLLRALGTKPPQIFRMVLLEVNILAVISILLGAILGMVINHIFSQHGIDLPQAFTYGGVEFKTFYTMVSARSLYIPAITVLLSATLISIFPALRAARTEPAVAMRMH
jgi:putative ABC transport system permease protein